MDCINSMSIRFQSRSENEMLARTAVASFVSYLDPTVSWVNELKTAVSEAVTNSIIHAYDTPSENINLHMEIRKDKVHIEVIDTGRGIKDLKKVKEKNFTTRPELERAGMGFTIMESFVDHLEVYSGSGKGTKVVLEKKI